MQFNFFGVTVLSIICNVFCKFKANVMLLDKQNITYFVSEYEMYVSSAHETGEYFYLFLSLMQRNCIFKGKACILYIYTNHLLIYQLLIYAISLCANPLARDK